MELYLFAVLPLALLSLFDRNRARSTAGFGFLAALAPVIAKGIGSLIGHKKEQSAQKQAEEQRKLEAQQADALAKQQWETQQNAPAAQTARFKNTFSLGRLAGAMGGLDRLPPSIANYYQGLRKMPEYSAQTSYVPTAKKGGGFWDFAGGVTDALSYLDTDKLKGGMGRTAPVNPATEAWKERTTSANIVPTLNPTAAASPIADYLNRVKAGSLANPQYPK